MASLLNVSQASSLHPQKMKTLRLQVATQRAATFDLFLLRIFVWIHNPMKGTKGLQGIISNTDKQQVGFQAMGWVEPE